MDVFLNTFVESYREYTAIPVMPAPIGRKVPSTKQMPFEEHDVSRYISKVVIQHIKSNQWHARDYKYTVHGIKVVVRAWATNNDFPTECFFSVLNFYIYTLSKVGMITNVNITVIDCDVPKRFPSRQCVLGSDHINSGYTTRSSTTHSIVVYRREEMLKVVLHELIHFCNLDFYNYPTSYDDWFVDKFDICVKKPYNNATNPLALYECYTEILAMYGHLITQALFEEQLASKPDSEILHFVNRMLQLELKFSNTQTRRLMSWMSKTMCEGTHIFSYYVLKTQVLKHFDAFRDLINTNGIVMMHQSDKFLDFVKTIMEKTKLPRSRNPDRKAFNSTLKMTATSWRHPCAYKTT
jgi:hypothetical protein